MRTSWIAFVAITSSAWWTRNITVARVVKASAKGAPKKGDRCPQEDGIIPLESAANVLPKCPKLWQPGACWSQPSDADTLYNCHSYMLLLKNTTTETFSHVAHACNHSQSRYGLETRRKTLFYLLVRLYANLCTVHGHWTHCILV